MKRTRGNGIVAGGLGRSMGIDQETYGDIVVEEPINKSRIVYRNNGLVDVVVLTERTNGDEYDAESLEWIADQCCRIMIEEFRTYFEEAECLVKRNFLLSLRRKIEEYMEVTGLSKEACASTILAVCVDWNWGLYCAFQLGNGIIIANDATPEPVFYPFNFRRNFAAGTTIAEDALLDLRFARGRLEGIQGFILLTSDRYSYPLQMKETLDTIQSEICREEDERNRGIAILYRERHGYERKREEAEG